MKKKVFKKTTCKGYNKNGIYIEKGVKVEKGTIVWSNNLVLGQSELNGCELLPNNHIVGAVINKGTIVGPFARIREKTLICENCKIGNFVEIKNSQIDEGTKISHLTYVGDAQIGKNCNLGCGTIFCNYDGEQKHKTVVGNNVFIGSNCNLIAPLTINDNSFIACATTVTKDIEANSFVIGRVKETIKPNSKA